MTPKVQTLTICGVGSKAVEAETVAANESEPTQSLAGQRLYLARLYPAESHSNPYQPNPTNTEDGARNESGQVGAVLPTIGSTAVTA